MTTCACGNCQFFDNQSRAAAKAKEKDSGLCRYNPPLPQSAATTHGLWPVVGAVISQQLLSASWPPRNEPGSMLSGRRP